MHFIAKCAGMADAFSSIVTIMAIMVIFAGIYWLGMIFFGSTDWKNASEDHEPMHSPDPIEIIGRKKMNESRKYI